MNYLSLFAGIGGLDLGLDRAGMTCVGQVELDPFCRRVLAKHWPEVPRHDDVRTAVEWWRRERRPAVDLVCGGFPCQPFSTAGRLQGTADERWGWPWFYDVVRALRPRLVLVENVAALLAHRDAFGWMLGDLAARGYDTEWDCVPAAAVGAPHRRDRVFLVAYPQRGGVRHEPVAEPGCGGAAVVVADSPARSVADAAGERRGQGRTGRPAGDGADGQGLAAEELANADGQRLEGPRVFRAAPERCGDWATEPDVGGALDGFSAWLDGSGRLEQAHNWESGIARVADGVPDRVDRLRGLGNAVVPQVAEYIGRLIMAADLAGVR